MKKPDRIFISKKARSIVDKIDEVKYLKLDQASSTTRSELFLFAMAIGIDTMPTKLEGKDGLILDKYIDKDEKIKAILYANFISELTDKDMLDNITDTQQVYSKAEEYANTGFEVIEDYMNTKKDTELMWDLIGELDGQYNDIFVKQKD